MSAFYVDSMRYAADTDELTLVVRKWNSRSVFSLKFSAQKVRAAMKEHLHSRPAEQQGALFDDELPTVPQPAPPCRLEDLNLPPAPLWCVASVRVLDSHPLALVTAYPENRPDSYVYVPVPLKLLGGREPQEWGEEEEEREERS